MIANVIVWPIAYLLLNRWLQTFAYRISIGWLTFLLTGMAVLAVSLLTVSRQIIRAATANPAFPEEVLVDKPTDALEAQEAADDAFTTLLLGLGAVSLIVGGVGIANIMVISVLERRGEIGLRRALGATRRHVAVQFLSEALLLGAMGGTGGVLLGVAVTAVYANIKGWATLVPPIAMIGGIAAALMIGGIAGLYPAVRAARLSPTEALRTT